MADKNVNSDVKPVLEKEKGKQGGKKEPWTAKRVITTIIIVALALLMVGSAYYIVIMIQQSKDDSNVFGYYDGEPVRYEAGSVFATSLGQSDYATALQNGDFNALWSAWYQAYQNEVIYMAMNKEGVKAGITVSPELVNRLIIDSGVYKDENSSFSEEVYKASSVTDRNSYYNYVKKIFTYQQVLSDMTTTKVSPKELSYVLDLATSARNFEYIVIDYNVLPDELALMYDISGMEKSVDENGNTVEPTLAEIKAYILENEPSVVGSYIDEALASATALSEEDFYAASDIYGLVTVENATNNIGNSSFLLGFVGTGDLGYLADAAAADENFCRTLFTEKEGYVTDPVAVDNAYIIVRVGEDTKDNSLEYYISSLYSAYGAQTTINDYAAAVFASDKFKDNFTQKFFEIFLSSTATAN
ncbi:MAG: hypothetical protein K5634_01355 [Sphaerochaetaceae bacterium]|nr:hypothetical protein [Sphaerochaetaceae bacterium]